MDEWMRNRYNEVLLSTLYRNSDGMIEEKCNVTYNYKFIFDIIIELYIFMAIR